MLDKNRDNRKYRDMSEKHLEPANSIITKIGIDKVAEVTGKHISRVYRWRLPKERGGTGGVIPQSDASALLLYARNNRIDLKPADFFRIPDEVA